jgi:hypothetical protein
MEVIVRDHVMPRITTAWPRSWGGCLASLATCTKFDLDGLLWKDVALDTIELFFYCSTHKVEVV